MSPTRTVRGAGGVALHVETWGDPADPAIVLVHGYPDTHEMWRPVAERLAADNHVVAYDVRGAGRSEAPAQLAGYGLGVLVDDLAAVLDDASPDGPAYLVGHDWGSMQGWHAVCGDRVAGRVHGFTSISGPSLDHLASRARRPPSPSQALRSWYIAAFHLPGAPLVARTALSRDRLRRMLERSGARTDERWPAPTLPDDAARGIGLYRANVLPHLLRPRPRPATVPVQLLVATGDSAVLPSTLADADRWAPQLQRVEIDAGHWVTRSHPDEVAGAILSACSSAPTPGRASPTGRSRSRTAAGSGRKQS